MELQQIVAQTAERAAQDLLGATLLSTAGDMLTGGVICEVEAYLAQGDAAAHGSRGRTPANASLYKEAGTLYLHSMHRWLLMDIVTEGCGVPSSVLIRGLKPTHGIEAMQERRAVEDLQKLTNGPGKVCQALGLWKNMDGTNILMSDGPIHIELPKFDRLRPIIKRTERIGISKNRSALLRFVLES